MPSSLKLRLSIMMFLEYFVPGATVPILSHYLKNYLHLEPYQVGHILAVPAIAACFAPFAFSHIADRYLSSEKLLALCHLLAACVMVVLSRQTEFWPFLGVYLVYGLLFTPTFGLTNAVALHHVTDAKRDFGGIRMWGTAGWVVVGWVFGYLWLRGGGDERLPHALYVSAMASCVLSIYALTLPRSHVPTEPRTSVMYWKALKLFAQPSLAVLCIFTFVSGMLHQVYYYGMSPFLSQIGFANAHIMPSMSLGQFSEVIVLGTLGACLARITIKQALIIGLLAQTVRYVLFATAQPILILSGILLHGVCYAFYFTAAYLYVDHHSTAQTRAGAQQIFTIVISGFGTFGGFFAGGYMAQWLKAASGQVDYRSFWLIPAVAGLALAAALGLFFREQPPEQESSPL